MAKRKGGAKPLSLEDAQRTIDAVNECLAEGFAYEQNGRGESGRTARGEAARRAGLSHATFANRLLSAQNNHGLEPDRTLYKPPRSGFLIEGLPPDEDLNLDQLRFRLRRSWEDKKARNDARKIRKVHIEIPGPIAIAFFGDPHVDDPGCAWGDLEGDVEICQNTPGMLAVDVGDDSNNWVGRLMKLYADQSITSKQALVLIEWLMTSLPWLVRIKGNHDTWNVEKGDVADYIHRLAGQLGIHEDSGSRMLVSMPAGCTFSMHVRHDFPGGSQFNPAHALVRETLFGFRDHILACGHRHNTGYIPVWHNDPPRLCHGFRVGTYKDFDKYAKDKGFQDSNWARAMAAIVDPIYAHDPVRYITPYFSLEEAADVLTWKRRRFEVARSS